MISTEWYGYSKVLTENLVDRYVRHSQVPATVIRFSNVWGAGEVLNFAQFHLKTFIDQLTTRTDPEGVTALEEMQAAYDGEPHLIVACDRNGRPWKKHNLEVRDIVHAYDRVVGNQNTFGKVYQIASREPFTWDAIVPYMAGKLGVPYSRFNVPTNPTFYEFDLSPARDDFGYAPQNTIEDMVDEAIRFSQEGGGDIIPTVV